MEANDDENERDGGAWRSLGDCLASYLDTCNSRDTAQSGEVVWNGGFSGPIVRQPLNGEIVPPNCNGAAIGPQLFEDAVIAEGFVRDRGHGISRLPGKCVDVLEKRVSAYECDLGFHAVRNNRTDRNKQRSSYRYPDFYRTARLKSMDMKQILERISLCRKDAGVSERALSISSGMSPDGIRNWRRRVDAGEDPGANLRSIEMVANALGVSRDWLATGQEDAAQPSDAPIPAVAKPQIYDNLRHVSVYDIEASAGDGAIVTMDAPLFDIGFSQEMLSGITNARNEELAVIRVRGDSMLPTLMDGDMMLVDTTKRNTNYDGMFILRYDDVLRVKRIDLNPSNRKLWVKSDNPAYDPFEVDRSDLDVIGRVVWIGRKV